jgi:ABC-type branched-subunit amino acid transport system substrate-binding protein
MMIAYRKACLATFAAAGALVVAVPQVAEAACSATIGVVMELTGGAGQFGQAGAKAVQMALDDFAKAGGDVVCSLKADVRDSQGQGTVGVDAAKQLVDIGHVPVIIGSIISSVTLPILTSVTAPAKVVQIAPVSSSPTFTILAKEGKTNGVFFRTIPDDTLQGVALAKLAVDQKMTRLAVLYVNNDYGVNLVKQFRAAYKALGGAVLSDTPYNEKQPSYQAEVTQALAAKPEALFLIGYPGDGATVARSWISQGGPQKFLLNEGLNASDFIDPVGAKYLNDAYGTSSGTAHTASTEYFDANYKKATNLDPATPAADRSYDAGAIVALAVAQAGSADKEAIRASIRKVVDPKGTEVSAGPDGFKKALALIKDGKAIRYVGVIGPIQFDANGDITGPFQEWRIKDGKVANMGEISTAEVDAIKGKIPQ